MEPVTMVAAGLAGASLLGNLLGNASQAKGLKEQIRAEEAARSQTRNDLLSLYGGMDGWKTAGSEYGSLASLLPGSLQSMQGNYAVDVPQFNYDKSVSDFLDPSMKYAIEQANRATTQSAASQGNLLSGAAQKALQKNANDIALQDWNNAYSRRSDDRNFGYKVLMDEFSNKVNEANRKYQQAQNLTNIGMTGLNNQVNTQNNTRSALSSALSGTQPQNFTAGINSMTMGQGLSNITSPQNMAALWQIFGGNK